MPACCNGCLFVDLIPDCIDKSCCWKVICCESCCHTNPGNLFDKCCAKCTMNCCPCCPECKDTRYNCCICACCYNNIIWDPMALCCGPWEGDFLRLKKKIEERHKGAPQAEEMLR